MSLLREALVFNRRMSNSLGTKLGQDPEEPFEEFHRTVSDALRNPHSKTTQYLVDVGGGRSCEFLKTAHEHAVRVIAFDVSKRELLGNELVDYRVVGDAGFRLPFSEESIDIITSRTVLEHVEGVRDFVHESFRVLAPEGRVIHLIPCRFAPFAVTAKLVPFHVAKSILHFLRPESKGVVEFPVYYEHCWDSRMKQMHRDAGFRSVTSKVYYYQANYFDAVFPVYVANLGYEAVIRSLRLRNLAAYAIVSAQK